ncbi:arsenate reductase ArsC [Caminibacter pacificus]
MKKVLILCTGNSCRSIMAEGLINKFLEGIEAKSAGSKPSGKVNSNAIKALKKMGAWCDDYHSKSITDLKNEEFDLAITVCDNAREACPFYPNAKKTIHIPFEDPDGKDFSAFEETIEEMQKRLIPRVIKELSFEDNFLINKIKGDLAENICRVHFENMGYDVSKVGVENISSVFAHLNGYEKNYIEKLKLLFQRMPDLLITHNEKKEAALFEVKYNKNLNTQDDLKNFSKYLHERYDYHINTLKLPVYFYVVTNKKPYVYVLKANHTNGNTGGFYPADSSWLDKFPIFSKENAKKSFREVYFSVIYPALSDIFE